MAKTLANEADLEQICRRIGALTPESPRMWGKMSVEGMLCHLHDSYLLGLGERSASPVRLAVPGRVIKYVALQTSLPWAKNTKSAREMQQESGGTQPAAFEADQKRLLQTIARFSKCEALHQIAHPVFGAMSASEWLRWGYLHADHHLRQFGG